MFKTTAARWVFASSHVILLGLSGSSSRIAMPMKSDSLQSGMDCETRIGSSGIPTQRGRLQDTVKTIYTHGHANPELISPDNWNMDLDFLARPHAKRVQLDLFYDYRTNVELYPKWQECLRRHQPRTIIFWAQNDIFFTPEGGEAFLKDLPKAEMHRLNSGHFAVEDGFPALRGEEYV